MVLKNGYMALALKLQEAVTKSPEKFKEKLEAALAAETEDGPWKAFLEAGARHSASDMGHLQAIHDASMVLGASCGGGMEEAARPAVSTELKLVESAGGFLQEIPLLEARTNYPILMISPGTGSTAHYPAEVLKREAAKFKPGTLMFWNHPTKAEESARPEGNLDNLAAITTSQGKWMDDGPKGPGIYSEAKVMADYAQKVEERAPHIGLSIRAGGFTEGDRIVGGKPVLKEFSHIESVDYVTKAGRGGLALAEAAKEAGLLPLNTQEAGMTAEETQRLIEAAVAPFKARAIQGDARGEATRLLETITLPQVAKNRIIERAIANPATTATGELDLDKLRECVVAESKAEGEYLAAITGGSRIQGMGISAPAAPPKPEDIATREARESREFADEVKIYESLGMSKRGAEFAAKGRAA